jgi:hypothetical protein
MADRATTIRAFSAARAAWGLLLVLRPRQVADALAHGFPADRTWLVRVLGARVAVQSAVLLARPRPAPALAGTAVDAVHAASMLPWLGSPRYRRAALLSGAGAAVSGLVTGLLARG